MWEVLHSLRYSSISVITQTNLAYFTAQVRFLPFYGISFHTGPSRLLPFLTRQLTLLLSQTQAVKIEQD